MKWILLLLVLAFAACEKGSDDPAFSIDVLNSFTPVKNQGNSQTCWAYAMLSAIETEHIMRGDSVHLSVAYVEKAIEQNAAAPASKRGMAATLINAIGRYGLVPYESMRDTLVPLPRLAFMYGMQYTVHEFARSVCAPGEYIGLGCSDKHPYWQDMVLDVPDNWEGNRVLNVPADSLLALTRRAVAQHRGVCWEGDISEHGFRWKEGVARLSLINGSTTDDHCMAIVGLAHDAQGDNYLIMKNSWGRNNRYRGLMFMHEDYFLRKTVAVYMPRNVMTASGGGTYK
ncbi:MAG: cysteine protease [Prevotella sp.]|nr:cysteine protease [Prevotella sp.]